MRPLVQLRPFGELAEFRNGVNFSASNRGAGDLGVIGVGNFQANERFSDFEDLARTIHERSEIAADRCH